VQYGVSPNGGVLPDDTKKLLMCFTNMEDRGQIQLDGQLDLPAHTGQLYGARSAIPEEIQADLPDGNHRFFGGQTPHEIKVVPAELPGLHGDGCPPRHG